MKHNNQVIAPQNKQLDKYFERFLLCFVVFLLVSFLLLSLFFGYGILLFLSEPDDAKTSVDERGRIGLSVEGAQFKLTFNEKSLSDFPPNLKDTDLEPSVNQGNHPSGLREVRFQPVQVPDPLPSADHDDHSLPIPLDNLDIRLKKDTVLMSLPLTIGETKKTITVEEELKIEDGQLVADIRRIRIGKLPIPDFVATYLLDSFAPRIIESLVQRFAPPELASDNGQNIHFDPEELQFSKIIMPPTLLVLFGPKDFLNTVIPEEWEYESPEPIETIPISNVRIDEGEILITGSAQGIKQLTIITTLILGIDWEDMGK